VTYPTPYVFDSIAITAVQLKAGDGSFVSLEEGGTPQAVGAFCNSASPGLSSKLCSERCSNVSFELGGNTQEELGLKSHGVLPDAVWDGKQDVVLVSGLEKQVNYEIVVIGKLYNCASGGRRLSEAEVETFGATVTLTIPGDGDVILQLLKQEEGEYEMLFIAICALGGLIGCLGFIFLLLWYRRDGREYQILKK
jgi:hypothetical protein